jgi:hypothetical protein
VSPAGVGSQPSGIKLIASSTYANEPLTSAAHGAQRHCSTRARATGGCMASIGELGLVRCAPTTSSVAEFSLGSTIERNRLAAVVVPSHGSVVHARRRRRCPMKICGPPPPLAHRGTKAVLTKSRRVTGLEEHRE